MALPAVAGADIYASDLYVLCQPSGGTELDGWYLSGSGYASGAYLGDWVNLTSHGATPLSTTHTTSTGPSGSLSAATFGTPNAQGVLVYASFSGASLNGYAGGTVTFQF